ncbi:hypothetical protein F443_03611 [Plasmopara halstedii]|uniref:CENP-V/GFA domain-containing protein n=1 Tax=Plasmopara halstedii TaxID=4781 RepID=A0A0P1AZG0_PLAHL|nr:hypothetical protein F443_03611 [Plasmopara halstedii]CEG46954.1 hypothetical protein F443_03611 [Plasmopara halstedii]|eukprot:XP_024583323.1 hypothetical protein F443_03611 [Plasmopara halstedii]
MVSTDCLDAWDDCFSFFKGKSPYQTTRQTKLSHFTRNQRVAWKLLGALGIFICSVFFQCLCLSWEGYFSDGREVTPPLLLYGSLSALSSVIAMWIAAVHLYQPTFNGPRILLHYRRSSACSWEILDWVFFEGSTTSTVVSFVVFWVVTLPYSKVSLPALHAFGVVAHFIIVSVDFYFTAPLFKTNHVLLVLMWPVFWIFVQYLWVISGHQPTNDLFNFHSAASPVSTLMFFLATVVIFYTLLWYSRHLQRISDKAAETADKDSLDLEEKLSILQPIRSDTPSITPFELVVENSTTTHLPFHAKSHGADLYKPRHGKALPWTMVNGMVREVDRAIGALSTLALGVGLLVLREVYRNVRDTQGNWERCDIDGGGKDVYYQKKYGMPKLPLFQHRGSCDCGSLRFIVLAPKRVEAFDDSNTFSCKRGRFPFLIISTSCFEMLESSDVSLYDSQATSCQHVFCAKCGIHIFQFDHTQPDCIAVNVYCVEDENFEDMKVIFIPKSSRPLFGRANCLTLPSKQTYRRPLQSQRFDTVREDSEESNIAFQKQMMMWARIANHEKYQEPPSDDTQSTTSSTSQNGRFSFPSSEDSTTVTKDQLEFYLKRHLDESSDREIRV